MVERLTKKFKTASGFKYDFVKVSHLNKLPLERGVGVLGLASRKLGQREDIEESIGIDFVTLFDILENGFWFKGQHGGLFHACGMFDLRRLAIIVDEDDGDFSEFPLSEFGKTWARTKEELAMSEVEKKSRKEEFEALAKVAEEFINEWGTPHSVIIIEQGSIQLYEGEMASPLKILD